MMVEFLPCLFTYGGLQRFIQISKAQMENFIQEMTTGKLDIILIN